MENVYFCERILQVCCFLHSNMLDDTKGRKIAFRITFSTQKLNFLNMEKELFQTTLMDKAKAANNNAPIDNLSERTINEVVTMFLPMFADDEKITDESWLLPVQMVKTMSGQLRHDTSTGINDFKTKFETDNKAAQEKAIADAIAAAKAEWEKNHQQQQPPKTELNLEEKFAEFEKAMMAKLTGDDSAFGKLSKQFGDYLKLQAEKEKAATEADIRSQVRDYLLDRGVDEEDFALEYTLEKLVIGENPDVNALKTKAEKDYEAYYKKIHKNDGANPFRGGGGGGNDSNKEFEDYINSKKAEAEKEAKEAESLRKDMM